MKKEEDSMPEELAVRIPTGSVTLDGDLTIPEGASSIVLFAHGTGSSRFSPRNRFVASCLHKAGIATLLMDLLTSDEEVEDEITARPRFNIPLLSERLVAATDWLAQQNRTSGLSMGYFGASTGAAAALVAASERPDIIKAIVSRGGRPDLAEDALSKVKAPTLLIVGEKDPVVIEMNRRALKQLNVIKELIIVAGATHLFPEKGALEEVAEHATKWFKAHLTD